MVVQGNDSKLFGMLYHLMQRLKEENNINIHPEAIDYQRLLMSARTNEEVKLFAARIFPKIFKFFPGLASKDLIDTHVDLLEDDQIEIRVQAILGLPLFCHNIPGNLSGIVDILVQLLPAEEFVERDAVHKSIMSLLRLDTKASLTALFKHIGSCNEPSTDATIRLSILFFMRDQVFPFKAELLRPQMEMERHMTDLINKSLDVASGAEIKTFIDFLTSLSIFGDEAPPKGREELMGIIEAAANLDAHFNASFFFMVCDDAHIPRFIACLITALPFFQRGASSSKFFNHLNKHIIPVFDKLPKKHKVCLVKVVAEISPYTTLQDCSETLPFVVQLIKKHMVRRMTRKKMDFFYVEGLLYAFHHLAHKAPSMANCLCGYKIVTGQPCDKLRDNFSENYKQFSERMCYGEEHARSTLVKYTQLIAATEDKLANDVLKANERGIRGWLQSFNNILTMIKPLQSKTASFLGDNSINLSWKAAANPCATVEKDLLQLLMDRGREAMCLQKKQKKRKRGNDMGRGSDKYGRPRLGFCAEKL